MDNTNKKIISVSFVLFAAIIAISLNLVLKILAGAFSVFASLSSSDAFKHGVPAIVGIGLFFALQFNQKVNVWADEVVSEIKKIVWPNQKDTVAMTIAVCVMVLISSVIILFFDWGSGEFIKWLMPS